MKQRLGIAQALLNRPKLLICDEPTSALDPAGRKEILDILLAAKEQTTILFSTHILSDVERICTEVAFLNDGKIAISGIGTDRETKEALNTAFNYFKANKKSISASIQVDNVDYLLHIEDLQGVGASKDISLASFVAMCSSALKKPMQGSLVILGSMSIGGTISKVEELANTLQVCFDSGAKKILLPMSSASDISNVPSDLFSKFNISFYNNPEDAVYKALGIE